MNQSTDNKPGFGFTVPTDRDHLADLGQIAGGLVHELKNPVGVILLNAELMLKQMSPALSASEREREEKRLNRIIDSARNVQSVVQSFLSYSRPGRLDPDAIDVNKLLQSLLDDQSELLEQASVQLSFHPDDNLSLLAADRAHLRSIFLNVITNAREALLLRKDDRRLLVVTRSGKNIVRIVIANNGPPFDERIAAHLFQPFSTNKDDGTGLGLAIVQRLVDLHHGTVTASSDATRGVSFTFEFPTELGPAKARTELPLPTVESQVHLENDDPQPPTVKTSTPTTTSRRQKTLKRATNKKQPSTNDL